MISQIKQMSVCSFEQILARRWSREQNYLEASAITNPMMCSYINPFFRIGLAGVTVALVIVLCGSANAASRLDRTFRECPQCPEMIAIPGGKFIMGSPRTEQGRFDSEGPQHDVTIRAFALGLYDVTTAEFLEFLRDTGYQPQPCDPILGLTWVSPGDGHAYEPSLVHEPLWPAICLSWKDAQAYIAWLNRKVSDLASARHSRDGPYRLPSEAEWEYAARAGTSTSRWWGDAIGAGNANCNGCGSKWDGNLIAPVGSFRPNRFGLYDMLGNVWQWVEDCWHENYVGAPRDGRPWLVDGDCSKRVMRGGSWSNLAAFVRSAARNHADAAGRDFDYSSYAGLRVARSLP